MRIHVTKSGKTFPVYDDAFICCMCARVKERAEEFAADHPTTGHPVCKTCEQAVAE